jgi:hypothetical protein
MCWVIRYSHEGLLPRFESLSKEGSSRSEQQQEPIRGQLPNVGPLN